MDTRDTINEIRNYIGQAYNRYLDYAKYQAGRAGIPDEAEDILGEVLLDVMQKDEPFLRGLFDKKKGEYRELDFYILKSVLLNATSDTSPYRHKYLNKNFPKDGNVQMNRLDLIDELASNPGDSELNEIRIVRFIFDRLALTEDERFAFERRFFEQERLSSLPDHESRNAYEKYAIVSEAIRQIVKSCGLLPKNRKLDKFKIKNQSRQKRVNELVYIFLSSHWKGRFSQKTELNYILKEKDYGSAI